MKTNLLLTLLFLPLFLTAQTETKPPKLRVEPGVFTTRYELGDKTTPHKEVALHLKKHEPDAYIKWKAADRATNNQLLWTVVGCAGMLTGVFAEKTETKILGYSVGAGGFLISIIPLVNENLRRQAAIDIYNKKYGY